MKPEDLTVRGNHRSGFQVEIRVGNARFVDCNGDLFDTPGEAEERRLEILAAEDGISSKSEIVPWTDQQKANWGRAERALRRLNVAYGNHQMIRSGEIPVEHSDEECRIRRRIMQSMAKAVASNIDGTFATKENQDET